MTTYVVGVGGTDGAQHPLAWAQAVATEEDAILAVHAWEIPIVTGYEAVATVDTQAIEDSADEHLRAVLAAHGDGRTIGRVVSGHPGRALADVAEATEGDVAVVVGHSGSSKFGLLMGSTANYVVRHVRCPVVVVRGECRVPVRTVVVGVDDPHEDHPDEPSVAALRWAVSLPGVERVEVHHAAFVPGVAAGRFSRPGVESEEEIAELDRHLRDAIAAAVGDRAMAAEVVPVVTGGTAAFALIEASREVDLVVIGTRGHSGLVELITGSTTLDVTAHAHCPVVIVR